LGSFVSLKKCCEYDPWLLALLNKDAYFKKLFATVLADSDNDLICQQGRGPTRQLGWVNRCALAATNSTNRNKHGKQHVPLNSLFLIRRLWHEKSESN